MSLFSLDFIIKLQKSLLQLFIIALFISLPLLSKDLDLNPIVNNAAKTDRPVLLFFHKPNCGYCDHMIEFTLQDPEIVKIIDRKFVFVDVYIKEDGKIKFNDFVGTRRDFAKHIGYDFYPTTVFIDSNRKIVHIAPGMLDQDDFIHVLNYVATKQYRDMEFQTYLDTLDFDQDF